LDKGTQRLGEFVVLALHLGREAQPRDPGFILNLVEDRLRIILAEDLVADPVERLEVGSLAGGFDDLDGRFQATSLPVLFCSLCSPGLVEGFVLAYRHVCGRA
jgi:hypothetical protein